MARSIVFTLVKESNRVSFIQERKNNVLYSCYTSVLTVDFCSKFSKNFYTEHWLQNFFCTMYLICFVHFRKDILVHFVIAGSLTKLLVQPFSTAKTKSCSFLSISITCYIFCVFPFWCFDQDLHPLVN